MLGLASEVYTIGIVPDYLKTAGEVFIDAAVQFLEASSNIDRGVIG
jgi:hypothetical protein